MKLMMQKEKHSQMMQNDTVFPQIQQMESAHTFPLSERFTTITQKTQDYLC